MRGVDKLYSPIIHCTVERGRDRERVLQGKYGAINQLRQLISSFLKTLLVVIMVPCYNACLVCFSALISPHFTFYAGQSIM